MSQSTTPSVSITRLKPDLVKTGWEGTVEIHGNGFDRGTFAIFDTAQPKTTYKTDKLLEAEVTKAITGTAGTKKVKVHTTKGDTSKEVGFVVS